MYTVAAECQGCILDGGGGGLAFLIYCMLHDSHEVFAIRDKSCRGVLANLDAIQRFTNTFDSPI